MHWNSNKSEYCSQLPLQSARNTWVWRTGVVYYSLQHATLKKTHNFIFANHKQKWLLTIKTNKAKEIISFHQNSNSIMYFLQMVSQSHF